MDGFIPLIFLLLVVGAAAVWVVVSTWNNGEDIDLDTFLNSENDE